jgi:hypothetical protein
MTVGLKRIAGLGLSIAIVFAFVAIAQAQTPISPGTPSTAADTAMIFQPAHPLIQSVNELAKENPNTWGLDASFSDYGFGGGAFLGHTFGPNVTGMLSLDFGTAEGSKEFDLLAVNKINRIFVIPIMASLQYRVFRDDLSDNLRPYVAVGAGPVIAMTTPYADDFFSAFGSAQAKVVPGGYIGLGANFGMDPKTNFGASLRYFIIPYPGAIESTTTESLTNLSGLFLTVSYGFNF